METRLGLFQVMTEEGHIDSEQPDAKSVLVREIEFAMGGLQRGASISLGLILLHGLITLYLGDVRDAALEILTIILKQDFDLINPVASKILGVLSRVRFPDNLASPTPE